MAQEEDLGVLVGAACRQQSKQREGAGEGKVGESQHDAASWCARLLAFLEGWNVAGQRLWT